MCRGNARHWIFHDERDQQRLFDGLALTVGRFRWELFSFVLMPDRFQFHLFFRTPQLCLARGMQYLASGLANWFAKRHRCPGHLLQGGSTTSWSRMRVIPCVNWRPCSVSGTLTASATCLAASTALADSNKLRQGIDALRKDLLQAARI